MQSQQNYHLFVNFAWMICLVMAVHASDAPYELVHRTFGQMTELSGLIELTCRNASTAEELDISDIKIWLNRTSANDPDLRAREDVGVVEAHGCCSLRFNLTPQLEGYYTCGRRTDIGNGTVAVQGSLPRTLISLQTIFPLLTFTATSGDRVILHCPIQPGVLLKYYSVMWMKDNAIIAEVTNLDNSIRTTDPRYSINKTSYSLVIDGVNVNDSSNNYRCAIFTTNPLTDARHELLPSLLLSLQVHDIDECLEGMHNCSRHARCTNLPDGGYTCECIVGFEGTGEICTHINECLEGMHNCSRHARCTNLPDGGYNCECIVGFEGNGEICTFSKEIIVGTSVTAGLLLVGLFLLLIITGSIKIGTCRRLRVFVQQNLPQHQEHVHHQMIQMNVVHGNIAEASINGEDSATAPERYVVVTDLLKSRLPPTFVIKSANLRVQDAIGQGEFGIIYKGFLAGQYTDEAVAIKTLKGFINESGVQELLSECVKMKHFNNLHVMSPKGVCFDGGPVPYIVLPYMANGSLQSYLKKQRHNLVVKDSNIEKEDPQVLFVRKRLMDMCIQVAKGMEYLTREKVVHRDLAARNCMIDFHMIIKVADFGLSVNIGTKEYYRLTKYEDVKLPVKWMAPESLADYMFSEMSDVWSYGVTCWEIFAGGQAPYAGVRPPALLSFLQGGERLKIPNNSACNTDLYSMMQWCWEMEPGERPSFSTLVKTISQSLEDQAEYLHVGAFTDPESLNMQAQTKNLE